MAHPQHLSAAEAEFCHRNTIPFPEEPAAERLRRLAAFRPAHYLFHSRCNFTGKPVLTSVPPDRGWSVYDVDIWLSDDWDPLSFGRPYDFRRPFFQQLAELAAAVPLPSLSAAHATLENSGFCNFISAAKSCYLVFSGSHIEECLYGRFLFHSRDLVDCFYAKGSELCYGCRDIQACYRLLFSEHCSACSDSAFLSGCRQCRSCYGCTNLSQREFCWFNEQLTRSDWEARRAAVDLGDRRVLQRERERAAAARRDHPVRAVFGMSYEGSTGNYLNQVRDCTNCFLVSESESLDNCIWMNQARSCFTVLGFGNNAELIYSSAAIGTNVYDIKFSLQCRVGVRELEYCINVESGATNCFGCISVRGKSFCILNKQYSEAEYRELVPRIREHMRETGEYGRFFPVSMNPYAYNESDAALFFPLEQRVASARGWRWAELNEPPPANAAATPVHVGDLDDSSLASIYRCEVTGKAFRIQKREAELLRTLRVAPPAVAPFERIRQAGEVLAWHPLHDISCTVCGGNCRTMCRAVLGRDSRPIACETCFQQLLVG